MRKFETLLLLSPELTVEARDSIINALVAVIDFKPAIDAPIQAAMPAISSSIWMNLPP